MALKLEELTQRELEQYSRQLVLPEVGIKGQRKLKTASVLLIGAGGLGSPLALYLAAAGVGTLGIIDSDILDPTNLHRQVLHDANALGVEKTISAAKHIKALNPNIKVNTYNDRFGAHNAMALVQQYDIVADGSDNFPTRYAANDACVLLGKPYIYGSVYRFEGQASVFDAKRGPCYRCLFPSPPAPGEVPSCAEGGVLGVLPGVVGLIQATETLKQILGIGESLIGRLLVFDAMAMQFRTLKLAKDPSCPVCGERPTIMQLLDNYNDTCEIAPAVAEIGVAELKEKLDAGEPIEILDVREPVELEIVKLNNTKEIPFGDLAGRMDELSKEDEIVAYCLTGSRSAQAAQQLSEAGFTRVKSLRGGIRAWIDEVDPSLPRY